MDVTAEATLFPWGSREGLPCVAVDITGEGDLPTADALVAATQHAARPGMSMLWIRAAPWGSYEFDKLVAEWTYGLPTMHVVATADIKQTRWSNLQNIGWVLDVTGLVKDPTNARLLEIQTVERSTLWMPVVQEIVVTEIDPSNILHPILTALVKMWSCETATLYVRPEQVRAATHAVSIAGAFAARVRA